MATFAKCPPGLQNLWANHVRCLHLSAFLSHLKVLKRPVCTANDYNPILNQESLPRFSEIQPSHVAPAMEGLYSKFESDFGVFEAKLKSFDYKETVDNPWTTIIEPLEEIASRLSYAWKVTSHLNGVRNSPELRIAFEKAQPLVVKASMKAKQSVPLYDALMKVEKNSSNLDEGQQRVVATFLRSARHGGVGLKGKDSERFNVLQLKLAELTNKFSNNVLDATKAFAIVLTDRQDVVGLPDSLLKFTAEAASVDAAANLEVFRKPVDPQSGPWKLTLDLPCFEPFMKYSQNRALREKMYKAYITRASNGASDNSLIIEEIRQLRQEKAQLLGFQNFAQLSLDSKMAGNPSEVWKMITDLHSKSKEAAESELQILQAFANENGFAEDLKHWDIPFWSQKHKEHLFSFREEELRPYFPLERVLHGLFKLASELFGINIQSADGEAEVWHPDVRFFNLMNEHGGRIASFFLDAYLRPAEKRGGAWMDECLGKSTVLNRHPVAHLVCNQSPPGADGAPSLMTFREVETLFHEFGHGLQHMLTTVPYSDAAGINNVEWDAVELPSQFMENWLYDKTTMEMISGHYKTGQTLPEEIFQQVCKARRFMAGSQMLRQLYFAALDMEMHTSSEPWRAVQEKISSDYTVLAPLKEDRFPCSFLHIFSAGYAAGYYSYKWAELMSADAFGAFEEVELSNRSALREVGRRFRDTVLASGGARHPHDVFQDFRGRPPSSHALLKSYGFA
ncbi:uncharacterized protein [Acropora muricata]|uniref:uncharacterized protein isoform X1 n=1 Tax=Acropora muricata TaxID=159855 RepID=UPI0034E5CEE9